MVVDMQGSVVFDYLEVMYINLLLVVFGLQSLYYFLDQVIVSFVYNICYGGMYQFEVCKEYDIFKENSNQVIQQGQVCQYN